MPDITLTMTTCKRFHLFEMTFKSLQRCCTDFDKISKVVCVDDGSPPQEQEMMKSMFYSEFPKSSVNFIAKRPSQRGLGQSMNLIWDNVTTPYLLHVEDDWEFIRKGPFIGEAMDIMNDTDHVKSVLIRRLDMFPEKTTKSGIPYFECVKGIDKIGQNRGHGYSLNPSLQNLAFLKTKFGNFRLVDVENSFGEEYYLSGLRTATLMNDYVRHIGTGPSAFQINNTPR